MLNKKLLLNITHFFKENYPEKRPKVEILPKAGSESFVTDDPLLTELLQMLYQLAQESAGEPVMFVLVDAAKEWLEGRSLGEEEEEEEEEDDDHETPSKFAAGLH